MTPEQFLLLTDPLPEPMLLVSGTGLILGSNQATAEQLGLGPEKLQGRKLVDLVTEPADEVDHYLRLCARSRKMVLGALVLRSGLACRTEGTLLRPRTADSEALLLLRLTPKQSAVGQFVALNQRIEELGKEVHRRQQAEELARREEERLRVTLQSIGDAVIVVDTHGRVKSMNPVAESLTGWRLAEALGQPLKRVFHILNEISRATVEDPTRLALRDNARTELANHTILLARDGTERPIDDIAAPIHDGQGQAIGAVLVFRDITERRRQERRKTEQLNSARLLASIVESSDDAIISKTLDGIIQSWNVAAERLFGYTSAQAVGQHIRLIIPADRTDEEERIMARLRAGEGVDHFETVRLRRDMQPVHVALTISPIRDESGRIVGASQIARDINQAKQAADEITRLNRELERRVAQFETLLNVVPICIAVADDPECQRIWTNPAFAQLVHLQPGDNVSLSASVPERPTTFRVVQDGQDVPPDRLPMQLATATGKEVRNVEQHLVLDDGSGVHLLCSAAPLFDETGKVRGGVFAGVDITAQKRHEAFLQGQKAVLERIVQGAPLPDVLDTLCKMVEEQADERLIATILLLEVDGIHLEPAAGRRAPAGWTKALHQLPIGPRVGSCGTAAYLGKQVVVTDIATDPLWAGYSDLALSHNLRACWSTPICSSQGKVLGTFAVYYDEPRAPKPGDLRLVELVTRTASIAIERARAEEQLRQSEEKFRLLAETIPQLAWTANPDGHIFWYNRRWYDYTGTTPEQMLGWGWEAVHDPAVLPTVLERWKTSLATGEPFDMVFPLRGADGRFRPFLSRSIPLRDQHGAIRYWFGTNTDVTDIREMQEALRAGQERLVAALDASDTGTFRWNPVTGEFLDFDDRLKRLFGFRPDEPVRTTADLVTRVHPEDIPRLLPALAACREGADFQMEYRVVLPGGEVRWLYDRARAVQAAGGGPTYLVGACTDITRRKQTERESQLSRDRLDLVVNSVDIGLWYCDLPFDKLTWNAKVKEHFGLPPDSDVTIHTFYERLHPDDRERTRRAIEWSIQQRTPYDIEYRTVGLDGRERWVRAIGRTFYGPAGEPMSFDGVTVDITDRVQQEQALQDANRRKDEFLAMLAHELRNPLAPIRNAAQVFRLLEHGDPNLQRARDMIERQVRHMSRLVDDLLDVSRITRGKITLKKGPVDLATVVASAVETSRPLIDARKHELTVTLPPESLRIDADATRVAQVFSNLLNNAAKYTEEGGHIRLTVARQDHEAVVRVRDNGLGIRAELLPKVFDLFTQGDRSLARSEGGLGIGLTLVKNLVEMHDGSVEAHSEGPGWGSEFVVHLPLLKESPNMREQGIDEERTTAAPASRRVLVVDDNEDAADSLAMLLQIQGHDVRTANDGPSALDMVEAFRPDLVILDIGLPHMDGYEVARRLRRRNGADGMLLAALTGYGQEEDRRRAEEAGFDAHFTKPADPKALQKLLARSASGG